MKYQDQSLLQLIRGVEAGGFTLLSSRGWQEYWPWRSLSIIALGLTLSYRYRANAGVLVSLRLVALAAIVGAVYFFMVRGLRRKASESQIARFVEERHRGLDERFVSAVEVKDQTGASSPVIVGRLLNDADASARTVPLDEIVPASTLAKWGAVAVAALFLGIGTFFFGPSEIRGGIANLMAPSSEAATSSAMSISVKPGNARVPKNSDQRLLATLNNFYAEPVTIFTRKIGAASDQWVGR